jgi:hypothetical protein
VYDKTEPAVCTRYTSVVLYYKLEKKTSSSEIPRVEWFVYRDNRLSVPTEVFLGSTIEAQRCRTLPPGSRRLNIAPRSFILFNARDFTIFGEMVPIQNITGLEFAWMREFLLFRRYAQGERGVDKRWRSGTAGAREHGWDGPVDQVVRGMGRKSYRRRTGMGMGKEVRWIRTGCM